MSLQDFAYISSSIKKTSPESHRDQIKKLWLDYAEKRFDHLDMLSSITINFLEKKEIDLLKEEVESDLTSKYLYHADLMCKKKIFFGDVANLL